LLTSLSNTLKMGTIGKNSKLYMQILKKDL
jgi:hypothetical protein